MEEGNRQTAPLEEKRAPLEEAPAKRPRMAPLEEKKAPLEEKKAPLEEKKAPLEEAPDEALSHGSLSQETLRMCGGSPFVEDTDEASRR